MTAQRLSWSILVLSGLLLVAGVSFLAITLSIPIKPEDFGFRGFTLLPAIPFCLVGWIITVRQPANALGWLFAAAGLFTAISFFSLGYALYGVLAHPRSLPGAEWAAWLYAWSWVPFVTIVGIHGLLIFPDGRFLTPRWRVVALMGVIVSVLLSIGIAFYPGPMTNFSSLNNPAGLLRSRSRPIVTGGIVLLGSLIVVSALSIVFRFRRSSGIQRQQLKWIAFVGVLLALSIVPTSASTGSASPLDKLAQLLLILCFSAIPIAVGIAVLRYRLYDIDLIINRTLVYGVVAAALAGLFAGANLGLQVLAVRMTGQHSDLVTGGLIVAAAVGFGPLQRRVRPIVDRILPGRSLLALLFTDIVGSTEAIVELGDEQWRALLDRYRAAVRQELSRHSGREVNTAGDAFFATFERPAAALQCAWRTCEAVHRLGLETRTGLHLGECEMRGEQVSGLAVHAAARVMSEAMGGEILISDAIRTAVAEPQLSLEDRGQHQLKGVPGEWHLYAVQGLAQNASG